MNRVSMDRVSGEVLPMFSKSELIELYDPVLKGVTTYSGAMCDGYTAMNAEWLSFINRRLHIDLTLASTLTRCRTPQEFAQEWSNFVTTAANDYRAEFERLAEISTATSKIVMAALHNGNAAASAPLARAP